jgi:transposase
MAIYVRSLTDEERRTLDTRAHSRTAPARDVERAKIVWLSAQGLRGPAIAQQLGLYEQTVRDWLKRFNAHGLSGLNDLPRPGKPPTYTPEEHSEVIATALRNPQELDLPFASWTLDRLQVYLQEHKSIGIKRSRIDELLLAEGLRWRTQETWFSEKAKIDVNEAKPPPEQDPEFAAKRGQSKVSISPRPQAV